MLGVGSAADARYEQSSFQVLDSVRLEDLVLIEILIDHPGKKTHRADFYATAEVIGPYNDEICQRGVCIGTISTLPGKQRAVLSCPQSLIHAKLGRAQDFQLIAIWPALMGHQWGTKGRKPADAC